MLVNFLGRQYGLLIGGLFQADHIHAYTNFEAIRGWVAGARAHNTVACTCYVSLLLRSLELLVAHLCQCRPFMREPIASFDRTICVLLFGFFV